MTEGTTKCWVLLQAKKTQGTAQLAPGLCTKYYSFKYTYEWFASWVWCNRTKRAICRTRTIILIPSILRHLLNVKASPFHTWHAVIDITLNSKTRTSTALFPNVRSVLLGQPYEIPQGVRTSLLREMNNWSGRTTPDPTWLRHSPNYCINSASQMELRCATVETEEPMCRKQTLPQRTAITQVAVIFQAWLV